MGRRTVISGLTVSAYWPHALTTAGFRDMKARWREYEKAGIVGIRGLQQAGAYSFFFRKGITKYNPRAVERVAVRGAAADSRPGATVNLYAHLTDPAAAQRWQHVYPGRLVRIYHRMTDIQVEIVGVHMEEFRRIKMYVFVFLDGLIHGPNPLSRGLVQPGLARPTEGRLRSLQEQDPDLFDLKKFDERATVYSVLCQGDRQPKMVTEKGAQSCGSAQLVKFWNFTEGRPVYYFCPSKQYPFLSFRAGEHPLGYCLPCCKKIRPLPDSKAQAINRLCLQRYQIPLDELTEDPLAVLRHVLSYGKHIPVGRISNDPSLLSDGLFYGTLPPPFVYRLVGVIQRTAVLPDAGFFYALAAALSLDSTDMVRDLADTAIAVQESYRSLAGGAGSVFSSAEDLADAVVTTFLLDQPAAPRFSPFEPGGKAAASWRAIIADLVSIRYDVVVVEFVDKAGDGNVSLTASATAAARIRACGGPAGAVFCGTPADVAILVTHPGGTYPFVAMEQKEFLRHAYGRGPARRFFSYEYHEDEIPDQVVATLHEMVVAETAVARAECTGLRGVFDLDFVTALSAAEGYRVLYRLINLRDMCYGVVLAPDPQKPEELVYFPVPYAPHFFLPPGPRESTPMALYGPRPPGAYPPRALAKVLAAANEKAGATLSRAALVPRIRLVSAGGAFVGFVAEAVCLEGVGGEAAGVGAYFFHSPVPACPWATATAEAALPYDMLAVDRAIYEAGGIPASSTLSPAKAELAEKGLHRHYLYRLFLAEFAALLRDERDKRTRRELTALLKRTRFSSPSSLASFRAELSRILRDFPEDVDTIRRLVTSLHARVEPAALRPALEDAVEASAFNFDQMMLNRLRVLGETPKVEAELRRLMQGQVELGPRGRGPPTPRPPGG